MELQDFDLDLLKSDRTKIEDKWISINLYLARTRFMPLYYNDFKRYPSQKFPYFVLCKDVYSQKFISLFKTEEEADEFYQDLLNRSIYYSKDEFNAYVREHMLKNRQPRYKYGRF